ncbi:MAG: acyltransferase [Verrucomicrobiia bacterium]|jgi:acetyltransferase-like isoleucine patch superfamily enzyme
MSESNVFIHPQAIVDSAAIGTGTRIWAFAHVCKGATLGANCNVGEGCFIEGGSRIGDRVTVKNGTMIWEGVTIADDVFVGPGVVFTNDLRPRSPRFGPVAERYASKRWLSHTTVGRGVSFGANATVRSGISIGDFAMIGAGAMVTTDVPAYALVFGNPARVRGYVCMCGAKLPSFRKGSARCGACGLRYRKTGKGVLVVE